MTTNLTLIVQTAQRYASELTSQSRSHRATQRGLTHTRRAIQAQDWGLQVALELYDGEELVNRKSLLFAYEKFLKLPKTGYSLTADAIGSVIEITVKADKFARLVRLHNKVTTAPFSDNWFDLIPGEEKVVTLPYYEGFRLEDIEVNSVVDVEPYGSKLYDNFIKAKFLLNPVNFVVKIGQPQSHFDYNDK